MAACAGPLAENVGGAEDVQNARAEPLSFPESDLNTRIYGRALYWRSDLRKPQGLGS